MKKTITKTHIEFKAEEQALDEARRCPHCTGLGEYLRSYVEATQSSFICPNCRTHWYVEDCEIKARTEEIAKALTHSEMLSKK